MGGTEFLWLQCIHCCLYFQGLESRMTGDRGICRNIQLYKQSHIDMMICNYFSCRASYGQPGQTYAINILSPPLFLALCVCVFACHWLGKMLLGHWLEQEEAHIACFSLSFHCLALAADL